MFHFVIVIDFSSSSKQVQLNAWRVPSFNDLVIIIIIIITFQ